jgi:hypothetical protein
VVVVVALTRSLPDPSGGPRCEAHPGQCHAQSAEAPRVIAG